MSFMKNDEGVLFTQIPKDYSDGRTKQSFKDATDINKLLQKAQRTGTISHLEKFQGQYGDFSDFDFMEAQLNLAKGKQIFEALPSEVRREFGQDAGRFFEFVNDPKNSGKLGEVLPELAKPGNQAPAVVRTAGNQPVKAPQAPVEAAGPPEEG